MEIIKGSLDDISRPASSEQRDTRVCSADRFELQVLSDDSAGSQTCSGEEEHSNKAFGTGKDQCVAEITEDTNEDSELQRAYEEMRRLDKILSAEIFKEKEIRRQRKELQTKLWQELQRKPDRYLTECAHEALNTKLFLTLEAHTSKEEEDDYEVLFETQVPDYEHYGGEQYLEQDENVRDSSTALFEGSSATTEGLQSVESNRKTPKTKNKQKDFLQRNIGLVSSDVGRVLLTHAEKERLAELLREINEEEEEGARPGGKEAMWATSVSAGQGYAPDPSDLEQLMEIDSKISLLLPAEEFHSLQSSYTDISVSQQSHMMSMHVTRMERKNSLST